jgi:hypothetical protein
MQQTFCRTRETGTQRVSLHGAAACDACGHSSLRTIYRTLFHRKEKNDALTISQRTRNNTLEKTGLISKLRSSCDIDGQQHKEPDSWLIRACRALTWIDPVALERLVARVNPLVLDSVPRSGKPLQIFNTLTPPPSSNTTAKP